MGLGHRVAREALAVEQRLEVLRLLLVGAVVGDDLGVAGVRRLGAEHDRRPARPTEDLVHERQLQLAEPLAPELGAEVRGPEATVADLLLERIDDPPALVVEGGELEPAPEQVERFHLLAHEGLDPVQVLLELGLGLEVPCHALVPISPRVRFPPVRTPFWHSSTDFPAGEADR